MAAGKPDGEGPGGGPLLDAERLAERGSSLQVPAGARAVAVAPRLVVTQPAEPLAPAARAELVPRLETGDEREYPKRTSDVAVEPVHRPESRRRREVEQKWDRRAKSRFRWRWPLLITASLLGMVIGSMAFVVRLADRRADAGRPAYAADSTYEMEPEVPLDRRYALFEEAPATLEKEALRVLREYAAARSVADALPWVRRPDRCRALMERQWQPWPSPPRLEAPDSYQIAFSCDNDPPFFMVSGRRADMQPFNAYFCRNAGVVCLDWEATEARCDVAIKDLPQATGVEGAVVRCELEMRDFHSLAFPDSRYRSYLLNTTDQQSYVWGYVERDGELDRRLQQLLEQREEDVPAKGRKRVTLRVTSPANRDFANQFLVADLLYIDWVGP